MRAGRHRCAAPVAVRARWRRLGSLSVEPVKIRDLFRDQVLMIRSHDESWIISLRSPNGDEDVIRLYRDREDALEVADAWMEAMGDDTELDVPDFALDELRSL